MAFFRLFCLCLFGLWGAFHAEAAPLSRVQVYRDNQDLKLSQIQALPQSVWQAPPPNLYFGLSTDSIWLKFEVPPDLRHEATWLRLERSNMDHVCLYSQKKTQWEQHCEGAREPLQTSTYVSPELIFPLEGDKTYYLQAKTSNILMLPIEIFSRHELLKRVQRQRASDWLALGALLGTCFYNMAVFALLREKIFLLHTLSTLAFSAYWYGFILGHSRLSTQAVYNTFYNLSYALLYVAIAAILMGIRLQACPPQTHFWPRLLRALQYWCWASCVLLILQWRSAAVVTVQAMSFIIPVLLMAMCLDCLRQRYWRGAAYLIPWLLFFGASLAMAFMFQGFLPFSPMSSQIFTWSMILPMVLLSWLLALWVRNLRQEQEYLTQQQLSLTQAHNRTLEQRVHERTQELESALAEVHANNQFKDKLFSILAHDLRSPFSSLQTMMVLLERQTMTPDQMAQMIPRIRHQVGGVYASLDNMLTWARAEMQAESHRPELLDPHGLIQETLSLYEALAEQKGVQLLAETQLGYLLYVDPHQLRLILRNLVNNALKFTPQGGQIHLGLAKDGPEIALSIVDSGVGMSAEQIEQLNTGQALPSSEGLDGEKGVGLGLELCRTYLHKNQGRWEIQSSRSGTAFTLWFPVEAVSHPMKTSLPSDKASEIY